MAYAFSKLLGPRPSLRFAPLMALLAGLILGGCGGDSSDPLPSLAQIKAEDVGSVVTTTGFVSVEPGILEDTTGEVGFALQDTSGGIYVTVDPALGLDLSAVKPGRSIQITGTLGDLNGWLVLVLENQENLLVSSSGGFLFFPQPNTLEEINNTAATPEKEATPRSDIALADVEVKSEGLKSNEEAQEEEKPEETAVEEPAKEEAVADEPKEEKKADPVE